MPAPVPSRPTAPADIELPGGRWVEVEHPIATYGMLSDGRTAALVSPDGSVDWLCAPRFDSPSLFAALLDPRRGGRFRVRSVEPGGVRRRYLDGSTVLATTFSDGRGDVVTVTDFLVYSRAWAFDGDATGHTLVRRVEAHQDAKVEIEFAPRADYARAAVRITEVDGGVIATGGGISCLLECGGGLDITAAGGSDIAHGIWELAAGETRWLVLHTDTADRGPHGHLTGPELLDLTLATWRRWTSRIRYDGPWRDEVVRSALVLKGLVYEPTGALVAAPTTSLPEGIGGVRNWDYRYAWIRDSAYVLESFLRIGHAREADTFVRWLEELTEQVGGARDLQPLYGVGGEHDLPEATLDHLAGYRRSRPVRVGNGAAEQLQLDIYGAALELAHLCELHGSELPGSWPLVVDIVATVADGWDAPDAGLWEIRSQPRHHTFSKFQCWLAVDRAIAVGRSLGLAAPYDDWTRLADTIRDDVLVFGWSDARGAFTQAYGEPALDASVLLLALKGLVEPTDARVTATIAAVRDELEVDDGLLLRYRSQDGLTGHEGAFLLCSFWLVELLARRGELGEAERLMDRMVALAGPLGLYAEEFDPAAGEHLGNFPQGFTHMGLIHAATAIAAARRDVAAA